jgi:hypothetical protein
VGPDGFEPSTSPLSGVRSNRAELWALGVAPDINGGCSANLPEKQKGPPEDGPPLESPDDYLKLEICV